MKNKSNEKFDLYIAEISDKGPVLFLPNWDPVKNEVHKYLKANLGDSFTWDNEKKLLLIKNDGLKKLETAFELHIINYQKLMFIEQSQILL